MVPKIVLDTNVLVSAFGWKGSPHLVLLKCVEDHCQLYLSPAIVQETAKVLSYPKFRFNRIQTDEFLALVAEIAVFTNPGFSLDVITADPSDNRILECALAGDCEFIVTGDKHLLDLGVFEGIRIATPDAFLALFPFP